MIAKHDYTAGLVDIRSGYGTDLIAHISICSEHPALKTMLTGKPKILHQVFFRNPTWGPAAILS